MAKRQYIISSSTEWTSNFGYSFLALSNVSGSGRKLTLRQMNIFVLTQKGAGVNSCTGRLYQSATPFTGENMAASSFKLNSTTTIPSTVVVRRGGTIPSFAAPGLHYDIVRRGNAAGSQNTIFTSTNRSSALHSFSGSYNRGSVRGFSAVEALTVPQNTGYALVIDNTVTETQPVRVNIVISIDGKTVAYDFVSLPIPGMSLFSVENTGTNVVTILSFSFAELGTSDTPYMRLVPIGQIYSSDTNDTSKTAKLLIDKMDSTYPALTALRAFTDNGFIPSGSPEVVVNEGSAGTPKGVNYLHTRDFNGPAYRVFLPEMKAGTGVGGASMDMLGHSNSFRAADMLLRRKAISPVEGLTMNPGEGIALVASSETFIGVQPAYSGWPVLYFQAIVDSEPQISPTLTLTGLKNPTEVRIFTAGTTTELTGQENVTSGTFTWNFDPDLVTSVDISILALGYQNTRLLNIATTGNVNIPVQQQIDRQYYNP
jgi:hypothetical protein